MKQYIFPAIAVVALLLGVLNALPTKMLGGQYNNNHTYFDGITNSGTLTQTGSAVFSGSVTGITTSSLTTQTVTNLTATNATSTNLVNTTLTNSGIATMATTSVKGFCVYNGTEFTKISFSAGSTTPAYTTSTSCL